MSKMALLIAVSAVWAYAQSLDFSSLDKLASKAKEANRVSLDENQLKAAMQMMGDRPDKREKMQKLAGLHSVNVRNYEFEKPGEYQDSDLDAVRAQVAKIKGCSKIVDSKEKNEHSEIYMCSEDGKATGLAIISAEPKELSVVVINGSLALNELHNLHGLMGMPGIELGPTHRMRPHPPTPPVSAPPPASPPPAPPAAKNPS
ncbi:MAG: DUF4252 domain-containing protein [Acidobacteriaceae bacterium]|nr:DUF4252 domain-containing protein [Acidobacteriaceae bacterium]